jgi:heme/copper-type cytochrome/quinol oxidase subunit 2
MQKLTITKEEIFNIFEWISVLLVAAYMIIYGIAKPSQFGDISNYTEPINKLNPMELMWAFYSYSKTFALIIGFFEVLGAILLVIPKTRLIGGFLLTTILTNIILQDYFFKVLQGALANAIFYQLIILFVFYRHRYKLLNAFNALKGQFKFKIRWIYIPIAILIALSYEVIMFAINQFLTLILQ